MNANLKKTLAVGSVTAKMIGLLTLVILTLHSCGSDGDTGNSPVYDENGNCTENCNGNGDASVMQPDNYIGDQDASSQCKVPTDPEIKKMCMPQVYKDAHCLVFNSGLFCPNGQIICENWEIGDSIYCSDIGSCTPKEPECTNSIATPSNGMPCASDGICKKLVTCEYWPPVVCWEFCGFLGEWDCPTSVWAFSFLPDQGDGLCHFGSSGEGALGKPGDPNPRYPLDGEPEQSYILSPDGQTLTSLTSMVTCTKL